MQQWAILLDELPASAQRFIARSQRISLPRGADHPTRTSRLRLALCHERSVRAAYRTLAPDAQATVQTLRSTRHGCRSDAFHAAHGVPRPWRQLLVDPQPQNTTERLLALGWLFMVPPTRNHPARYRLAPELRRWLPTPAAFATHGPALTPTAHLADLVAATILTAAAERPLALGDRGALRRSSAARLLARTAPWLGAQAMPAIRFVLPLLHDLGLLLCAGGTSAPTIAASRFLAQPRDERIAQLRAAWLATPAPDAWLLPLLTDRRGIDWSRLRRRLCAWAEALPPDTLLDPATLYPILAAAHGPLADAHTHGYRAVDRAPWQPRRAATIFAVALAEPLHWLGLVGWYPHPERAEARCVARVAAPIPATAAPWRYGAPGELVIPHAGVGAGSLVLARFARWIATDAEAHHYRADLATLGAAAEAGWTSEQFRALLRAHAGEPPEGWSPWSDGTAAVQLRQATLLIAEPPALLRRAARDRSLRRHLAARPAPGLAVVAPGHEDATRRALARQGVVVAIAPSPPAPLAACGADECAAVALALAYYRQHAPATAPPLPPALEARFVAALPAPLRRAVAALTNEPGPATTPTPPTPRPVAQADTPPTPRATLRLLRRALRHGETLDIVYDSGRAGPTARSIRPLAIEQRGDSWYTRAYCLLRRAEREFRLDRLLQIAPAAANETPALLPDQEVGWRLADPRDAQNLDALHRSDIEEVAAHVVGALVDQVPQRTPYFRQLPWREVTLEDAPLDVRAVALEQGGDPCAAAVIDDVVADHGEHLALDS